MRKYLGVRGVELSARPTLATPRELLKIKGKSKKWFRLTLKCVEFGEIETKPGASFNGEAPKLCKFRSFVFVGSDPTLTINASAWENHAELSAKVIPKGSYFRIKFKPNKAFKTMESSDIDFSIFLNGKTRISNPVPPVTQAKITVQPPAAEEETDSDETMETDDSDEDVRDDDDDEEASDDFLSDESPAKNTTDDTESEEEEVLPKRKRSKIVKKSGKKARAHGSEEKETPPKKKKTIVKKAGKNGPSSRKPTKKDEKKKKAQSANEISDTQVIQLSEDEED